MDEQKFLQEVRFATGAIEELVREVQADYRAGRFDPKPRPDYEIVAEIAGQLWVSGPPSQLTLGDAIQLKVEIAREILAEARRQCAGEAMPSEGEQ